MEVSQALKLFRKELPEGYDAGIERIEGGYEIDVIKKTGLPDDETVGCRYRFKLLSRGLIYKTMAGAVDLLERETLKLKARQASEKGEG